jgi:hypothetical protein
MANNMEHCPFHHATGRYCSRTMCTCTGLDRRRFEYRKCSHYKDGVRDA